MIIRLEWDPAKAKLNLRKHRVSFETAARVFADPLALMEQDRIEHGEWRWRTLGRVEGHVLLVVAHTVHDDEDGAETLRLISARRADPKESKRYEEEIR